MNSTATSVLDPSVFIGGYPFRHVPHPDPDVLVRVMDREHIARAWVGHLPSVFYRDPSAGNGELYRALEPFAARLAPAPAIRPDFPAWEAALDSAVAAGAAAVRVYPRHWGLGPGDSRLAELAIACGERQLPIVATVRFEDLRQRHPLDTAGDVDGATLRAVARAGPQVRLVVCAAGRELIEEVHWGLTPAEQTRVLWDISWIWGPPEDHLARLLRSVGPARFTFGSQWPLRLVQSPWANLELLPDDLRGVSLGDPARLFG